MNAEPLVELLRSDYCCMRDYLFVQIELQNSHRSGVSSNLLLDEYKKATMEGDLIRIKVKKHKTAREYGPAKLYFSKTIFEYLKIFVDAVRCPQVFLSFTGQQMASGAISKQINAMWQRAGVYGDTAEPPKCNMNCTIFRKSASTAVLEHRPEVASLLAHSEKTQRKYYNARRRDLSTALGAGSVNQLLRHDSQTFQVNNIDSPNTKNCWSDEERAEIQCLFKREIDEESITMDIVKHKISSSAYLKDLPLRKVYDRVRNYYRYKLKVIGPAIDVPVESPEQRIGRTVDTPDLSSEDDDELFTPPSTASMISGCEKVFTCDDVMKLRRLCSSITGK